MTLWGSFAAERAREKWGAEREEEPHMPAAEWSSREGEWVWGTEVAGAPSSSGEEGRDCAAHLRGRRLHGSRAGRGLRAGPGALGDRRRRWRSVSRQSSACVRLRESCFPVPRVPWLARLRASARPSASPAAHADAGGARRGPSANSGGAGNVAAERSGAARGLTSTGLMRTPCSFETRRSGAKLSPGDVCLGKKVK